MLDYGSLSDQELAVLLKREDHGAYTEIYERYWPLLYIHAKKMLQDKDEAMDVVQDIFTSLWKNGNDFDTNGSFKPYLYTAVRNRVIKLVNRGKLQDSFAKQMAYVMTELVAFTDDQISYNELERIIEKEISLLPPKMQVIFHKSKTAGKSHKDIAKELGVSEHTVKTTVYRAMIILREKITSLITIAILIGNIKDL